MNPEEFAKLIIRYRSGCVDGESIENSASGGTLKKAWLLDEGGSSECKAGWIESEGRVSRMEKLKVAFICVHNSCRSQIAEALGRYLAGDVFDSFSAGTEIKPQINQDAVRLMKELYGIDMEANGQRSKLVTEIPVVDVAISMGCNVGCPFIGRAFDDNWGLEDPTGKPDDEFKLIIGQIEKKILELQERIISEK